MLNSILAIGVIFTFLWLLGIITSYTLGGAIHILLIIAVIMIVFWTFKRRR